MTPPRTGKRIYVLDTNVLMHDPTSLFRFEEHDVFLPMMVLEELDAAKKGTSEVSRNVRQASRFIDEMIAHAGAKEMHSGVPLRQPDTFRLDDADSTGQLLFQVGERQHTGPADNDILASALRLRELVEDEEVVLVSKDINLRIKATIVGLPAEDYQNDHALTDLSLLFTGFDDLPGDFWNEQTRLNSWNEGSSTFYEVEIPNGRRWHINQCLIIPGEPAVLAMVREIDGNKAVVELAHDYQQGQQSVWGIQARNPEQNFALNMLMDPDIHFVTLMGNAGTGKTLLSLAAGLAQTLDSQIYREIIVTRATVPVGEDIGFLPGTEEEKMTPWMGALTDNLEVLAPTPSGGDWAREATNELLAKRIKVRSMNFMRGRTFLNRYVIIDEAQNLTPKQMKTLLTRAGPGTKMICMGNIEQIDTPYLTETSSGLTYVVDRFKDWQHSGHITLRRGERSPLADYAATVL